MKKIVRLTESDMVRLVNRVINEQSGDSLKEELGDLKEELKSKLGWDPWKDADDLLVLYKKLLPYKGKKVSNIVSKRFSGCGFEHESIPALHYFNLIWNHRGKFCMGDGIHDFIGVISDIGNNDFFGKTEKSKDAKFTTPQVKQMIINLVKHG